MLTQTSFDVPASGFVSVNSPARKTGQVIPQIYRTLVDLRAAILALDAGQGDEPDEVVIVLDDRSAGQLPALLARRNPGGRLTLVPLAGRLPGSFGGAGGWQQIALKHDARSAITTAVAAGNDVLVLWPAAISE